MARAGSSPEDGGPASASLWILPPVLVAAASVAAVLLSPAGAKLPVTWCGVVATVAVGLVAGEALRRGRTITALRRQQAEREAADRQRLADQEAETRRLATDLLPVVVDRLQRGVVGDEVLRGLTFESEVGPEFRAAHAAVLRAVIDAVEAEEGLRDTAQRAFVNIARRVQAIVHQQAQDLREMEDKHGKDPDVFGDLLHLDHGTALIGRLADSIAVLGGARPGRQWQQTVPLFNVLRGAMSRIMDYRRVDLHSVAEIGIVGPTVEPLIHALSELLDNATRYSPPQTRVHLTASEVQSGVAVEIEDAGVGLTDEARVRADEILAQASAGLDLDDLGETPRLGLAVVGSLAKANDFTISLRPSAYGGVRAVLIVPEDQTTTTPTPGGQIAKAASLPPPRRRSRPGAPVKQQPAPSGPVTPANGTAAGAGTGSTTGLNGAGGALGTKRPAASGGPLGPGPAEPPPAEINANGLPQRRRSSAAVNPRPRTMSPGQGDASSTAQQRGTGTEDAVQPGIWLADFHNAVNGEPSPGVPDSPHSGQPSEKDE
ncbi:ATP-binding protein [Streptomyces sp. HNM0574]|uniref:sensor histidine kinase n=1 Tax=Streptomyces sp. HNM0574 TaxID=2714954 RepID=UPI001F115FCB|nr:ATP-binding protein [Streptomyces sp. HNM0574]